MKIRVTRYNDSTLVVQILIMGFIWWSVEKVGQLQYDRGYIYNLFNNRWTPLLYHDYDIESATKYAYELSRPGALKVHYLKQKQIWEAAKIKFKEIKKNRKVNIVFDVKK